MNSMITKARRKIRSSTTTQTKGCETDPRDRKKDFKRTHEQ